MADQFNVESRRAGGIAGQHRRCGASDPPAGRRCAGHGIGMGAQQHREHTRLRGGHRQASRRRQIEHRCLAPGLDHNSADLRAFHDIAARTKQSERIGRFDQDDTAGVSPQFGKAGCVKTADRANAAILAHPEQWGFSGPRALREQQGKASGRARIFGIGGKTFMQCRTRDAAAETRVGRCFAEQHARAIAGRSRAEARTKCGKRANRTGHLFLLCSYSARCASRVNRHR